MCVRARDVALYYLAIGHFYSLLKLCQVTVFIENLNVIMRIFIFLFLKRLIIFKTRSVHVSTAELSLKKYNCSLGPWLQHVAIHMEGLTSISNLYHRLLDMVIVLLITGVGATSTTSATMLVSW